MFLLFDIGATKMRAALSVDGQSFAQPVVQPTPASPDDFCRWLEELTVGQEIKALAGGASRKIFALIDLREKLNQLFSVPIYLENDAALAGLGEAHFGAGRGADLFVYLTVSTGVGGARIVKGRVDINVFGFEPGRQIVNLTSGETLEDLISGRALERKFGRPPREIADSAVWQTAAENLAYGLANSLWHWSAATVVVGGSMMKVPGIALPAVQVKLNSLLANSNSAVKLLPAELGDFGGLYGALALLKEKGVLEN